MDTYPVCELLVTGVWSSIQRIHRFRPYHSDDCCCMEGSSRSFATASNALTCVPEPFVRGLSWPSDCRHQLY